MVNTPGRHKKRQLCHINMIKPYTSRGDSVSQPFAFVNSVPKAVDSFDDGSDELGKPDPGQTNPANITVLAQYRLYTACTVSGRYRYYTF